MTVTDHPSPHPAGLTRDDFAAMPGLVAALDPARVSLIVGHPVFAAQVVRRKPLRRVLVEYDTADGPMLGKLRAGHRATTPFRLLGAFREAGFSNEAPDLIAVPEPVAVSVVHGLWVQRLVAGESIDSMLRRPSLSPAQQEMLGRRAADSALKIHRAGVAPRREHTPTNELLILVDRLNALAARRPEWSRRLDSLLRRLSSLAESVAGRPTCGIHRDFYPDQLLVDGTLITIVDFDLYCLGDRAVDVGNFAAHVIELALRFHGNASALDATIDAFVARYLAGAGEEHADAIQAYTTLTLARLVALSVDLDGRHHVAAPLLDIVEQRVGG